MRVLAITPLWPNAKEPQRAAFNRQQLRELSRLCDLEVLAAIPTFPGAGFVGRPARTALLASLPARDVVDGVVTHTMRQLYVPKVGVPIAVPLYLASLAPYARLAHRFDVLLATWAYPDGCAAVLFGAALGKPCVVKVHGTDMNVVAKLAGARAVVKRVLPKAAAVVTVSRALGREVEAAGVDPARIVRVDNGVDGALFAPRDDAARALARRALGVEGGARVVLFVGRVEAAKGSVDLFAAFGRVRTRVADARLVVVGEVTAGQEREVAARKRQWGDALRVTGPLDLAAVAQWMVACDLVTLPSHREGAPNVLLEARASGRPVVATNVGGIPEIVDARSGVLVAPHDADGLAVALEAVLTRSWDAHAVAEGGPPSWRASAEALHDVLARAVSGRC